MNQYKLQLAVLFSTIVAIGFVSSSRAWADEKVDNPKYALWSKFKPGSNSTVSADIDLMGKKIHVDVVKTLVSVSDQELVVNTAVKATVNGGAQTQPSKNETIPSKTDRVDFKPTGEKEVDAMGKTFKCKVWDAKADPNAKTADGMSGMSATIYTSEDVPGGLVKLEGIGKTGAPLTFVLTATESR